MGERATGMKIKTGLIAGAILIAFCGATSAKNADLVLRHGRISTENPAAPEAEAVAIEGNRILAVGKDAVIAALIGKDTQVIDLKGRRVTPGFNDAHVHFLPGGYSLIGVQLLDAKSRTELRDRIAAYAKGLKKGQWILNGNWYYQGWTRPQLPDRQLIDAVTPDNPVAVWHVNGHIVLANSLALKLAGIDRNTPDPAGGTIEHDASGEPTGILKDAATDLVLSKVPRPSVEQQDRAVAAAMELAKRNGITSVQDMAETDADLGGSDRLHAFERAQKAGKLTVRVYLARGLQHAGSLVDYGITTPFGDDLLRVGDLKSFADGAAGSMTAWMVEPFEGTTNSGMPSATLANPEKMYANFHLADKAGLQLVTHAIGDKAISRVLDLYAQVEKADGPADRRMRIEHVQHAAPADIPRFAKLGVIASMQPYHAIDDGRWVEKLIGHKRAQTSYAWRSLLDSGATLAFGSDWPVAPLDAIKGIYAAATRATLDGKHPGGWIPGQRITVAEALHAYTVGSAYAEFQEKVKGSIEPGKLADLAVLSGDIFAMPPAEIRNVKVDMTIFDGKVIYQRE